MFRSDDGARGCSHGLAPVDLDVVWVGTSSGLEARIAAGEVLRLRALAAGKVRRTRSLRSLGLNLRDLVKVPLDAAQAVAYVLRERPTVVFSVGGYVCVPTAMAMLTRRRLRCCAGSAILATAPATSGSVVSVVRVGLRDEPRNPLVLAVCQATATQRTLTAAP